MTDVQRRGDWMQTFTGLAFYPIDPRPDEIEPTDIAHALSMLCRYGGHVTRFYSVAEHCVLMSHAVAPENALWALLHDATEAYMQDLIRPIKRMMPEYCEAEDRLMGIIAERFGISPDCPAEVKAADNRILLDERAALMNLKPRPWAAVEHLTPLGVPILGWSSAIAESRYRNRLDHLTRHR